MDAIKVPRVVIVGGGFGGLEAARQLRKAAVQVTLIDRRNFHLFQPLLYQVATAGLSPANIATPLRYVVRHQRNCEVLLAEVVGFDVKRRGVLLADGEVPYDTLILAAGASHSYFGRDDWEEFAPGLKTLEQATEIRRRVLTPCDQRQQDRRHQQVIGDHRKAGQQPESAHRGNQNCRIGKANSATRYGNKATRT